MRPDPEMLPVLIDTARALKGSPEETLHGQDRQGHGTGWATLGPRSISGWSRVTIRKG